MAGIVVITLGATAQAQPEPTGQAQRTPATQACPEQFHQIPLYPEAKLCQPFADSLPASLIYHAKAKQHQVLNFYQQKQGTPGGIKKQKNRVVLQYNQGKQVIILSDDGNGTQVDILIQKP